MDIVEAAKLVRSLGTQTKAYDYPIYRRGSGFSLVITLPELDFSQATNSMYLPLLTTFI